MSRWHLGAWRQRYVIWVELGGAQRREGRIFTDAS